MIKLFLRFKWSEKMIKEAKWSLTLTHSNPIELYSLMIWLIFTLMNWCYSWSKRGLTKTSLQCFCSRWMSLVTLGLSTKYWDIISKAYISWTIYDIWEKFWLITESGPWIEAVRIFLDGPEHKIQLVFSLVTYSLSPKKAYWTWFFWKFS